MTAHRSRGEGSLYWHEGRQRWIAEVTIGYDGPGKRKIKKGSGRTKTEAKAKLRQLGARKLRNLSAEVDRWLAGLAPKLSTRSLRLAHGCLNRAISRAVARDKVKRRRAPGSTRTS